METQGHDRKLVVCFCEMLGTALFIFGILQTNLPLTIPFSLLASVILWGNITGGHFNPAVTLGVYTTLGEYRKNFSMMILLIFSQLLGGLLAIVMNWLGSFGKPDAMVGLLAPINPITGKIDNAPTEEGFVLDL